METSKWQYQTRLMEESDVFAGCNTTLQCCISSTFLHSALANLYKARSTLTPYLQVRYCSGAKYIVRHLRPDQGKIDAGYCARPSLLEKGEL
jgi:hypothetical protein